MAAHNHHQHDDDCGDGPTFDCVIWSKLTGRVTFSARHGGIIFGLPSSSSLSEIKAVWSWSSIDSIKCGSSSSSSSPKIKLNFKNDSAANTSSHVVLTLSSRNDLERFRAAFDQYQQMYHQQQRQQHHSGDSSRSVSETERMQDDEYDDDEYDESSSCSEDDEGWQEGQGVSFAPPPPAVAPGAVAVTATGGATARTASTTRPSTNSNSSIASTSLNTRSSLLLLQQQQQQSSRRRSSSNSTSSSRQRPPPSSSLTAAMTEEKRPPPGTMMVYDNDPSSYSALRQLSSHNDHTNNSSSRRETFRDEDSDDDDYSFDEEDEEDDDPEVAQLNYKGPDLNKEQQQQAKHITKEKMKKKKRACWFRFCLLIMIVLLLLALLGIAAGLLKKANDEKEEDNKGNDINAFADASLPQEQGRQMTLPPIMIPPTKEPTRDDDDRSDDDEDDEDDDHRDDDDLCPFSITSDLDERSDIFLSTGCFEDADSLERHTVLCHSHPDLKAMECSVKCYTRLFGVTGNICKCFSDVPSDRLGIGSCSTTTIPSPSSATTTTSANTNTNTKTGQNNSTTDITEASSSSSPPPLLSPPTPMELYINLQTNQECQSEITAAVRDFLVQEDNAPFGFDIVSNTFRTSPFQLFPDECGTNIYEVYTDVSEDRLKLQTSIEDVQEFAQKRREESANSIEASVSGSYNGGFFKVAAGVSASSDREQTNLFESSGAQQVGSKVFRSTAVRRLARVEIPDFEKRASIVTFSSAFARRLKDYVNGQFAQEAAFEILDVYGQFVLRRGIFGGYMEHRMTMSARSFEEMTKEDESAKECFEVNVWAKGSAGGGSVSAEAGSETCSEEQQEQLSKAKEQFESEAQEQGIYGGTLDCDGGGGDGVGDEKCSFEVDAATSRLLTTKDKYPSGDEGIKLLPLTEFLNPEKISPLEVKRWHISEVQFRQIQEQLEKHTLEYLLSKERTLQGCNCTADVTSLAYLVDDSGTTQCKCYSPEEEPPTMAPSAAPTFSPRCEGSGFSHSDMVNDVSSVTLAGRKMGDNYCKNAWLNLACGANFGWDKFNSFGRTQGEWFKATVTDGSSCTGKLQHKIVLSVPEGVNYDLKVYKNNLQSLYAISTQTTGREEQLVIEGHDGGRQGDTFDYYVKVEWVSGSSCTAWTLDFYNHQC